MKNMKRALSLVLTMAMLLGMFLVPTNAASTTFTDANLIENTEAVQITSGIGLFAGTTSGEFAPKATVTRAQMATIIVKMLRGSDFNADAFKGVDKFPDTVSFEGGWAEGYINACVQLGVVAGYGDGTFKPGKAVTTAEALTMIINALGVDPGPGEWPMTYMAKAEAMKLYGELAAKPDTNSPLNRDQLAVIVWEGMKYSPAGTNGYSVSVEGKTFTFDNIADAVKAAGGIAGVTEVIGEDSLASKVYELKNVTGWVTANQASGEEYTELTLANGAAEAYGIQTGLDMLGHYVTVYYKEQYKNEEEPGEVYTIVDESTVVTVKETISTAKKYKEAFGKSIAIAETGFAFDGAYVVADALTIDGYVAGSAAPKGTYIIAEGTIVSYIAPITTYAAYIASINTGVGNEKVFINGIGIPNTEGDDCVVEYSGMAAGDFVTYVKVGDIYVLSPVEKVTGVVNKTSTTEIDGENYDAITLDDTLYPAFEPKNVQSSNNLVGNKLEKNLSSVSYGENYTLYVTEDGRYIGFETAGGGINLENTVYLLGSIVTKEKDSYGKTAFLNKARGADTEGKEVMILVGKAIDSDGNGVYEADVDTDVLGTMNSVREDFYMVEDSTDKDAKKEGIQVLKTFANNYSPDTPTYKMQTYSAEPAFKGTNIISTMEGVPSDGKASSKFIFISGGLNDSAPLTITVQTGGISPAISLSTKDNDNMIVTRVGGKSEIEVFVRVTDEDMSLERIYVYATQEQLDNRAKTADGYSYTVYSTSTGKETEVILGAEEKQITVPGFAALREVDEDLYRAEYSGINLRDAHHSNNDEDIYVLQTNLGFWGVTGARVRSERIMGRENAIVITAGNSVTTNSPGPAVNGISNTDYVNNKATSVPVIDLRSEEEIAASGVDEILNMNQLIALQEADPGLMVVFDFAMYGHYHSHESKAVFIKKVMRNTVGMNSILYIEDFGSDSEGDYATGFAASTLTVNMGEEVKVYADRIDEDGMGFYRYTVDADGNIALVPFDADAATNGTYGMFGIHDVITEVETIDGATVKITTQDQDHSCNVKCVDSAFEALKKIYVTNETMIYDQTRDRLLTLEELAAMGDDYKINVDYYCAQGVYKAAQSEKDDTVEILVITSRVNKYPVSCDGNHEGWTAVSEAGAITQPGNYYLANDITGVVSNYGISVDCADVTLCLCGHNIAPAAKGNGAVRVQNAGSSVELINCVGRSGGIIDGAGMQGGRALYIAKDASATMRDGVTMTGVTANDSTNAAVQIQQGTFNMYGGTIRDNIGNSKNNSGAVWVSGSGAEFNMYGGTISGNTNNGKNGTGGTGGGVTITSGAFFNMSGGSISNNTAKAHAGGVYNNGGTFIMTGGTITGNTAGTYGGGVTTTGTNGRFELQGGTISNNIANSTSSGGGGVGVWGGTFRMTGGTIIGNSAPKKFGSGVYGSGGTIEMVGGSIENNVAQASNANGTGIYVANDTKLTMTGGTLSGSGNLLYHIGKTKAVVSGGTVDGAVVTSATNEALLELTGSVVVTGKVSCYGHLEITGGTFEKDVVAYGTAAGRNINISGGTFNGAVKKNNDTVLGDIIITGGTFANDPSAFVASTHQASKSGSKWTVKAK